MSIKWRIVLPLYTPQSYQESTERRQRAFNPYPTLLWLNLGMSYAAQNISLAILMSRRCQESTEIG